MIKVIIYIHIYIHAHIHKERFILKRSVKHHGTVLCHVCHTSCIMAVVNDYILVCKLKERWSTILPTFEEVL